VFDALLCCVVQYTGEDTNVSADSAGDDVYTWNVELWKSAFRPDCQLAKVSTAVAQLAGTSVTHAPP
jgi:hypothetical protein